MLACFPTSGNQGLEAKITKHFGSAPYFTLYDTETKQVTVIDNADKSHSHGNCRPLVQLSDHAIGCVVCGGMGRRAIDMLNQRGIRVLKATTPAVSDLIAQLAAGELAEIDPAEACIGHGHPQGLGGGGRAGGCGHGHGGQGRGGQGRGGAGRN